MGMSRNPKRYVDAQKLLDIAIAQGECRVVFDLPKQCTSMAQRVNAFQRLMEKIDPDTPYTGYMCQKQGENKTELYITLRTIEASGGVIQTDFKDTDLQTPVKGRLVTPLDSVEAMLKEEGLLDD